LFVAVARDLATGLATSRSNKVAARQSERAERRRDDKQKNLEDR
jgi:hypothetical protein